MPNNELETCPFCGEQAFYDTGGINYRCFSCGSGVGEQDEQIAQQIAFANDCFTRELSDFVENPT